MDKLLLGALEAGGTKMVLATGYADGTIVESISLPTTTPEETIPQILNWFKDKHISALGAGCFGPTIVNPNSPQYGQILDSPKVAWKHFDFVGTFTSQLNVPCGYDTDVNVACLGETTFGCAKNLDNVVYLTIGTGIGAGVLIGGQLLHGMLHPEAGHILIPKNPDDPIGNQSNCPYHKSCLEALVAGPSVALRIGATRAKHLENEPETVELLSEYLAQALATYILCYSPQKIIIGGGVADNSNLIELSRDKVLPYLGGFIKTPELQDMDSYIVHNSLEGKQGIMGCLELAHQALC